MNSNGHHYHRRNGAGYQMSHDSQDKLGLPVVWLGKDFQPAVIAVNSPDRNLQRLKYLDDLDLDDSKRLAVYHVVPGATLRVTLWSNWESLVMTAYKGDTIGK